MGFLFKYSKDILAGISAILVLAELGAKYLTPNNQTDDNIIKGIKDAVSKIPGA